jgi:hypothetical protein
MNDKNTWYAWIAVAFVLGLIIGFLGHWLMVRPMVVSDVTDNSTDLTDLGTATSSSTNQIQGDNGVIVNDQPAGSSVTVEQVLLQNPGWVAIQDDNNGVPGKILGAELFDKGTNSGTVSLLRKTVSGVTYFAVLRTNVGDYHYFNAKNDTVLDDSTGAPIMIQFMAENADGSIPNTTAGTAATTTATSSINLLNI